MESVQVRGKVQVTPPRLRPLTGEMWTVTTSQAYHEILTSKRMNSAEHMTDSQYGLNKYR